LLHVEDTRLQPRVIEYMVGVDTPTIADSVQLPTIKEEAGKPPDNCEYTGVHLFICLRKYSH